MDKYGPEIVVQLYNPSTGSLGLLVIDNTSLGPGLGGVHFSQSISVESSFGLARLHTMMCSLHDVPFGGACAYIIDKGDRKLALQEFALEVSPFANKQFIAFPGEHMGEREMEHFAYSTGDVRGTVGKPSALRGIPFEAGAVGLGIAHCIANAAHVRGLGQDFSVALYGLNRDGLFAARMLSKRGARVVVATDGESASASSDGMDIKSLTSFIEQGGIPESFPGAKPSPVKEALNAPADVLLISTQFTNKGFLPLLKHRVIVQGALNTMPIEWESILEEHSTLIPDILAFGGSCLSSHIERIGGSVLDMNEVVANSMARTTLNVMEHSGRSIREASARMALDRIDEAMRKKGAEVREWRKEKRF